MRVRTALLNGAGSVTQYVYMYMCDCCYKLYWSVFVAGGEGIPWGRAGARSLGNRPVPGCHGNRPALGARCNATLRNAMQCYACVACYEMLAVLCVPCYACYAMRAMISMFAAI